MATNPPSPAHAAAASSDSRLLLIDGHSMAYRAFYALPAENFTAGGQHTNAVYGFIAMLINLLRDEKPTHVAVAFDVSRETFRTKEFTEYKANRTTSPDEFKGQVELIKQVLDALQIREIGVEGFEADDIIATLTTQAAKAHTPVMIASGDRDAFQLVTDSVTILYPKRGVSELTRMTPEEVQKKYSVGPEQYRALAALVGETSDNLPGIPGVGPKTAAKWVNQYGSLESIVEHAAEVKGKVGDALRDHLAQVQVNWNVNGLVRDMELPLSFDELVWPGWDRQKVHEIFDSLQFRVLRTRLAETLPDVEAGRDRVMSDLSAETSSQEAYAREVRWLGAGEVSVWLSEHGYGKESLGVAFAGMWGRGTGSLKSIAFADSTGECAGLDVETLTPDDEAALTAWLAAENALKAIHDMKGPLLALMARGWNLAGVHIDTAIAAYLLHPDQRNYELDDLCLRYCGQGLRTSQDAAGQLTLDGMDVGTSEEHEPHRDLAEKAAATARLAVELSQAVEKAGAARLMAEVELPLAYVLASMEKTGIAADTENLADLSAHFAAEVVTAVKAAHAAAGREFNLGSPKQVQAVLFDELGLPKTKRIKTGYTTDADALTKLLAQTGHPVLEQMLRHRDVARLGAIVDGLIAEVADDGRIHTTFNQMVAATGRLSSSDPNLQNIPIRTAEGRRIREMFVPGKGYEALMSADYSQIELRVLAHLSGDPGLRDAFSARDDLHVVLSSRVFGVKPEEVTPDHRRRIKAVAYGLAYGLSSYGLAQQLGTDPSEASELMEEFFSRFGGIRTYLKGVVDVARQEGYTETLLGRRRYLPDLTSDNRQRREMAERMALNAPIQGTAADIMKLAMLRMDAALAGRNMRSRVLLQVHDELVLEVANGEREALASLVSEQLSTAYALDVPLEVSIGVGPHWDAAAH